MNIKYKMQNTFSPELKDFISKILVLPNERISIEEALQHPFITKMYD